jgi:rRNA small subunit pseudouridine methyltransferase Nep1
MKRVRSTEAEGEPRSKLNTNIVNDDVKKPKTISFKNSGSGSRLQQTQRRDERDGDDDVDDDVDDDDDNNDNDDVDDVKSPSWSHPSMKPSSSLIEKGSKPISGGAVTLGDAADAKTASATVTLVLEQASLESVKTKRGFELMNCDEHGTILKKAKRDPAESRPDILHQLLLCALDSPLNKAGHLRILVQSKTGVLIEISPHTRIPRTFKRFAGLMVQLLHKMRVRAADGSDTLLKVIKNPVTAHLPIGATVVGLEMGSRLVDPFDLPSLLPPKKPVVFVIGAMSHGNIEADYITQSFSVSRYPLSAACALSKLLNAFEHSLSIL